MFRLFNYWRSSASYRVRLALELKGIEFDYQPVHLVREGGEQFSAAYRRINPQSRVPTLQGEDLLLTQSMAILEWLEETYPTPALLPPDRPGRARVPVGTAMGSNPLLRMCVWYLNATRLGALVSMSPPFHRSLELNRNCWRSSGFGAPRRNDSRTRRARGHKRLSW
jgi:hypothetical protein